MGGRRGKPAALKRLEGNPGKQIIPSGYVEPTGEIERPVHVTGFAQRVWDQVVLSMPPGVYRPTDTQILAAYCAACATHHRAEAVLLIEGDVIQTERGPKRNPWSVVASQARLQMASLGGRLGLDPMAREHITAPDNRSGGKFTGLVGIDGGRA